MDGIDVKGGLAKERAALLVVIAGLAVTFTDLLQAGVVIFAAGYISILAFTTVDIGTMVNIPSGWQSIIPPWHMNMPPRL